MRQQKNMNILNSYKSKCIKSSLVASSILKVVSKIIFFFKMLFVLLKFLLFFRIYCPVFSQQLYTFDFILHVCAYLNCETVYRQYLTVTRQQVWPPNAREKTSNAWAPENGKIWNHEAVSTQTHTHTWHFTGAHELWTPVALRQETINICA